MIVQDNVMAFLLSPTIWTTRVRSLVGGCLCVCAFLLTN